MNPCVIFIHLFLDKPSIYRDLQIGLDLPELFRTEEKDYLNVASELAEARRHKETIKANRLYREEQYRARRLLVGSGWNVE